MSYTLVSASVLGYELAHLPRGTQVARVLLAGLTADTTTLAHLAGPKSPTGPTTLSRLEAEAEPHCPADGSVGGPWGGDVVWQLHGSRAGGARVLDRLVRHEVLGPACTALRGLTPATRMTIVDALAETAVREWSSTGLDDLGPGAEEQALPVGMMTGPAHRILQPLLDLDPDARRHWQQARPAEGMVWAQAMHQACWAAHLSGRVRDVAAVQLMGVIAFGKAGLGPSDATSGSWSALAGALQAASVSDLLDNSSMGVLLAPLAHCTLLTPG